MIPGTMIKYSVYMCLSYKLDREVFAVNKTYEDVEPEISPIQWQPLGVTRRRRGRRAH